MKPELAERIALYRDREGISMPQFLQRAIDLLDNEPAAVAS